MLDDVPAIDVEQQDRLRRLAAAWVAAAASSGLKYAPPLARIIAPPILLLPAPLVPPSTQIGTCYFFRAAFTAVAPSCFGDAANAFVIACAKPGFCMRSYIASNSR